MQNFTSNTLFRFHFSALLIHWLHVIFGFHRTNTIIASAPPTSAWKTNLKYIHFQVILNDLLRYHLIYDYYNTYSIFWERWWRRRIKRLNKTVNLLQKNQFWALALASSERLYFSWIDNYFTASSQFLTGVLSQYLTVPSKCPNTEGKPEWKGGLKMFLLNSFFWRRR